MNHTLFENNGAAFSDCRKYRYALWRIWDETKPLVMFIGLNPSKANEDVNDPTIKRVIAISKNLGYGGCYMMNCFAFVSTNPDNLKDITQDASNDAWLYSVSKTCKDIIFAWGAFKQVKQRAIEVQEMFPFAKALEINKDGSPKHPLYVKTTVQPVPYYYLPF